MIKLEKLSEASILKYYSFLNELPKEILKRIDLNVLAEPTDDELKFISQLKDKFRKNVVLYRKDYQPVADHLCKTIRYALLNDDQLMLVKNVESLISLDKILVVYERPLVLFDNCLL